MAEPSINNSASSKQLRLARALDASLDGVVIVGPGGRIEYVNPAFTRMTGYEAADVVGRRSRFSQMSADGRPIGRHIREKLSRGEEWRGEVLRRRKDGSIYFADMTISTIRDDAGQLLGFVSSERDVTERKVFTDELIKAREVAEESLKAKDMFLATVSHELRTPLTSIIGFADLLLLDPTLSKNSRDFADSILRCGRHLKQLIHNVLDVSRFATGKFYLDLEPLHLREVLEETLEMVGSETDDDSVRFALEVDPVLPETVVVDRMKLQQVLLNLLTNAVKHADGGEIQLSVQPLFEPGRDHADSMTRSATFLFAVSDQGPGIPPEQQKRIFESFVQIRSGEKQSKGGVGLGLAISRRLVELMGGTIWVDSKTGEGSRFSFILPLATPDDREANAPPPMSLESTAGPKMLLHRMVPGPIPGEGELASWGYQIAVTQTPQDMHRTLETGDPCACIIAGTTALSEAVLGVADAMALSGDRVAWFLYARDQSDDPIPMGRVVPIEEDLGPRAVVRLMRSFEAFPTGVRRLLVDPDDRDMLNWAHATLDARGIDVVTVGTDGSVDAPEAEDAHLLLLDLSREPIRSLRMWRSMADCCPRLLVALRLPAGDMDSWSVGFDHGWRRTAADFRDHSSQRLRWMLNAMHTVASHDRMQMANPLKQEVSSDGAAEAKVPRTDRPVLVVDDDPESLRVIRAMLTSLGLPHLSTRSTDKAVLMASNTDLSLVLLGIGNHETDRCQLTRSIRHATRREHLPIVAMTASGSTKDQKCYHEAGCVDILHKPLNRGELKRILLRWIQVSIINQTTIDVGGPSGV